MRENMQTPMPAQYEPSGIISIHSVFETIQGEGPLCGERALFIRLFGCNLRCPGCDTDYTSRNINAAASFMVNAAKERAWPVGALVVITGGEPFRQNIAPSIKLLLEAGYRVQIETNGVMWHEELDDIVYRYGTHEKFQIVCSPKTSRIHARVMSCATAFKYVLQRGQVDADGLPLKALGHTAKPHVARPRPGALVYVQPMDEDDAVANVMNLDEAIRSVMANGYRLQIQIHKLCNLE